MVSLIHNGCRLCFQTEGTCWREGMVERYREMRARRQGTVAPSLRRWFSRPMLLIMLAPVFGALTGGALGTALWIIARAQTTGAGILTESIRYLQG